MVVIVVAGKGQIVEPVGAAMLFCNDMFHMKAVEWLVILVDSAILAPMTGTLPNELASLDIHERRFGTFSNRRALA